MNCSHTLALKPESVLTSTHLSPHSHVSPVPVSAVTVGEGFWKSRIDANQRLGIPSLLHQLEEHGAIDNFRRVSGHKSCERQGPLFTDSDVYKWMEAAAWSLAASNNPVIKADLDRVIDEVIAAQQSDGYLNTFFVGDKAQERFTRLQTDHELYCAGHLFQAAVAHFRITGEVRLLDCSIRFADYLAQQFGPSKIEQADGHPEIEMALVELFRTTGNEDYLALAGFFIGLQHFEKRQKVAGHAVREGYICAGVADYVAETGSSHLRKALDVVWKDMTASKVYITGGLGSRHQGEAVGDPYELPNETAYAETCAAVSNIMWSFRMLGLTGYSRYADMLETCLYNGFLSGVSLDTAQWFYVNPLACWHEYQRSNWFGCTCCPTNVVRTLASLPGYMYGISKKGVWVHLYDASTMAWKLDDGTDICLVQETDYPWTGNIKLTLSLESEIEFSLYLRIPSWCRSASVNINGQEADSTSTEGYWEIARRWKDKDVVSLTLAMPVELMEADLRVAADIGRIALQRGPVVFCLESIDNPNTPLQHIQLSDKSEFHYEIQPDKLGGIVALTATGETLEIIEDAPLYRPVDSIHPYTRKPCALTAIPYYAWANRGTSQMLIWIPFKKEI